MQNFSATPRFGRSSKHYSKSTAFVSVMLARQHKQLSNSRTSRCQRAVCPHAPSSRHNQVAVGVLLFVSFWISFGFFLPFFGLLLDFPLFYSWFSAFPKLRRVPASSPANHNFKYKSRAKCAPGYKCRVQKAPSLCQRGKKLAKRPRQ